MTNTVFKVHLALAFSKGKNICLFAYNTRTVVATQCLARANQTTFTTGLTVFFFFQSSEANVQRVGMMTCSHSILLKK